MKIKISILRKESKEDTKRRILSLCDKDKGAESCPPSMNAQVALNELCDHLLGEDWYVVDPLCNVKVNPIIVYEIERKYKKYRRKEK